MKQQEIHFSEIFGAKFTPSKEFSSLFPKMEALLQKAALVEFTINSNKRFRQYIWTQPDGSTIGWLCRLEHCIPQGRNIIPEHILLSNEMGGIISYWIDKHYEVDVDTLIDANNFTFCLPETYTGIGGLEDNYISKCEEEGIKPLDPKDFVTFALEANGNTTFYHKDSKEVFFFAHDGYSPIEISLVKGQPEYTIHRFESIVTFVDYVEALASQWSKIIK